jgi:translation initiation factor 1 (eIF-1/SUI1)
MKMLIVLAIFCAIWSCDRATQLTGTTKTPDKESAEGQFKKDMEEIKKNLKGDIKIKLKKDAKGSYSWEITGKDAQEVLKANETLRKKLSD